MVMWIISLLLAYVTKANQNLHGLSQGKNICTSTRKLISMHLLINSLTEEFIFCG